MNYSFIKLYKMQRTKLQTYGGDTFSEVSKKAKEMAAKTNSEIEFEFNGITCIVDEKTVLDWLNMDYKNAHIMEWKEVGPDCVMSYDVDTEIELRKRQLAQAERRKQHEKEQREQEATEKAQVDELVKGVHLLIWPEKQEEYNKYVETNSKDGYSRAVVDYAEYWAKLMQIEISKGGTSIKDIADETQQPLGFLGITGFMYGCAVNTLVHFWRFGEELRKWHNKEYGHEGEGVVNPAILTISSK